VTVEVVAVQGVVVQSGCGGWCGCDRGRWRVSLLAFRTHLS